MREVARSCALESVIPLALGAVLLGRCAPWRGAGAPRMREAARSCALESVIPLALGAVLLGRSLRAARAAGAWAPPSWGAARRAQPARRHRALRGGSRGRRARPTRGGARRAHPQRGLEPPAAGGGLPRVR